MNILLILMFGMFCIPVHILAKRANSRSYSINKPNLQNSDVSNEIKTSTTMNSKRDHQPIHIGNQKEKKTKKRTPVDYNNKLVGFQKINDYPFINVLRNVETYSNPEAIPYEDHVDGTIYQTSERFKRQKDPLDERQKNQIKVKIKHHHHHHHHNHIKEVIKTVPKAYTVEKVVHIPIEKIMERIVQVPKIVNVTVEKVVHIPIEKIVEKVIHVPKPVPVPKPYVVEKIVEKIVYVPKPYPVLKTVPYPVEIKIPIPVEKKFPLPFKVEVDRKVPIYIQSKEPLRFEQQVIKSYGDEFKLNANLENALNKEQNFVAQKNDYHNRINQYKKEAQHVETESELPPEYNHFGINKNSLSAEQSTSETEPIPVKLISNNAEFRIHVVDTLANDSVPIDDLDLQTQASANHFHGMPLLQPIQLVNLQPIKYNQHLGFQIPVASGNLK